MMPGPPRITLDQESFKALASDVRVGILKLLDERRQTVTDLSNLLSLSKPTLLEHLEKLQAAGLVKRIDEGRKWIYYELSDKGRKILHPEKVSIVVALSTAVGLAAIGIVALIGSRSGLLSPVTADRQGEALAGPSIYLSLSPADTGFAVLMFVLAGASVAAALILRWWGTRRRTRFFARLGAS